MHNSSYCRFCQPAGLLLAVPSSGQIVYHALLNSFSRHTKKCHFYRAIRPPPALEPSGGGCMNWDFQVHIKKFIASGVCIDQYSI